MILPNENPVLAKIERQTDLGLQKWYEVVFYSEGSWRSFDSSYTFMDGE